MNVPFTVFKVVFLHVTSPWDVVYSIFLIAKKTVFVKIWKKLTVIELLVQYRLIINVGNNKN